MQYLTTTETNHDWLGRLWEINSPLQEPNPNYAFLTYTSPLLAVFFNPVYEQYPNLKIHECSGVNGETYGLRNSWTELVIHQEIPVVKPTLEQFLTFGIVCSLTVNNHQLFTTWALNWLKNIDRTPETAKKLSDTILELLLVEDVTTNHAAILAVAQQSEYFAACAAHRAFHATEKLDIEQLALLTVTMSPEELGTMLS